MPLFHHVCTQLTVNVILYSSWQQYLYLRKEKARKAACCVSVPGGWEQHPEKSISQLLLLTQPLNRRKKRIPSLRHGRGVLHFSAVEQLCRVHRIEKQLESKAKNLFHKQVLQEPTDTQQ